MEKIKKSINVIEDSDAFNEFELKAIVGGFGFSRLICGSHKCNDDCCDEFNCRDFQCAFSCREYECSEYECSSVNCRPFITT